MESRPGQAAPPTFRRAVAGILVVSIIIGWVLGPTVPANGFVLLFAAIVMGTAFFGRAFALPGAAALLIALRGDLVIALALSGVVLLVGERVTHLRHRVGRFVQRSFTDRLTGLFNYDFLQAQVRYEIDRVRRYGGSCSILVLDLDHFKKFNDTHGHQAGNLLLRAMADTVREEKRDSDFAARFGGEEFVVLVPADADDAVRLAERLRRAVAAIELPQLGPDGRVTVSIGVSSFPEQATNASELFERADQALYVAKGSGRNRTIVYPNTQVVQRAPGARGTRASA
ncbi:MAG: response regulator receiver modulated diguanylate cyclase [Thermoleophilia bacterium]|nr:response regulator receiver modulated diguanylate cyclase [Thermoleophilia bacterium]